MGTWAISDELISAGVHHLLDASAVAGQLELAIGHSLLTFDLSLDFDLDLIIGEPHVTDIKLKVGAELVKHGLHFSTEGVECGAIE